MSNRPKGPPWQAYFIVTPNPSEPNNYTVRSGTAGYFIKFGDGNPHPYGRCNPSFKVETNILCPTENVRTLIWNTNGATLTNTFRYTQPGKFLEHAYLKSALVSSSGSEWWFIAVKDDESVMADPDNFSIESLRLQLLAILEEFPKHNTWHGDTGFPAADESKLMELWGVLMENCQWVGARIGWHDGIPKFAS